MRTSDYLDYHEIMKDVAKLKEKLNALNKEGKKDKESDEKDLRQEEGC